MQDDIKSDAAQSKPAQYRRDPNAKIPAPSIKPVLPTMDPLDAVATCMNKYIDFDGAASRAEYWWFALFIFLFGFLPMLFFGFVLRSEMLANFWYFVTTVLFFLPCLAVTIRRLHDAGLSGFYILVTAIPMIGSLVLLYFLILPSSDRPYKKS